MNWRAALWATLTTVGLPATFCAVYIYDELKIALSWVFVLAVVLGIWATLYEAFESWLVQP